jgi:hypothetical protein
MTSDFTWVETPNDPEAPLPDGRMTPLQFQCDKDLDYIMVDAGAQAEECAYRAGAFRGPYAAHSSIDGSRNVVLFREDGWPVPPKVIPRVQGLTAAALQPLDSDVVAAWSLLADRNSYPMVTPGTDRSGHGNDLGTPNSYYSIPDLIPGQASPLFGPNTAGGFQGNPASTALHILGELTVTMRVWCPGIGYGGGYLWSQSNYHDGSEAGNCIGSMYFNTDGSIAYFAMNGPGKTPVVATHSTYPTRAAWNYISLRRNAAGTSVTIGLNNVNETFSGLLPPTGGGNSLPAIGVSSFGAERPNCGIADVVERNVSRSDADLAAWYKIAMGL